jgi:hypothetical protein
VYKKLQPYVESDTFKMVGTLGVRLHARPVRTKPSWSTSTLPCFLQSTGWKELPETINGRAAMIGFLAAAGAELFGKGSVLAQLSQAPQVRPCGHVVALGLQQCSPAEARGGASGACAPSLPFAHLQAVVVVLGLIIASSIIPVAKVRIGRERSDTVHCITVCAPRVRGRPQTRACTRSSIHVRCLVRLLQAVNGDYLAALKDTHALPDGVFTEANEKVGCSGACLEGCAWTCL